MDGRGRLVNTIILRTLGWSTGQSLHVHIVSGSVLVNADPAGSSRIDQHGRLSLSVGLCRLLRLAAGDRVLLVADPPNALLVLHPSATLDKLLAAHHRDVVSGGQK